MNTKRILFYFISILLASSAIAQTNSSSKNKVVTTSKSNTTKSFAFTGSYTMKFTVKETNGKMQSGEIKSAFEGVQMASIPTFSADKNMNVRTVFNMNDNTMTMYFFDVKKNKKNGMMMKIPSITQNNNTTEQKITNTIQKTNETKIIDGYNCTKWIINYSDGATCVAWISKDLHINTAEAISFFTKGMKGKKSPINTDCANINACALQSTYTAKDGSTVNMKMTDIKIGKPDAAFFSSSGYEVTDVTGIQFFK